MRGEVADRVVAPVVAQAAVEQVPVVDELVHREQFDRGDAEAAQVVDRRGMCETGIGAAQIIGDVGVALGEALDVRLVDDRLVQRRTWRAVVRPVEERVVDDALRHVRCAVVVVTGVFVALVVGEARLVPVDIAVDRLRVRVEEQLRRVAPQARRRIPRPVYAVAVALARHHARKVGVPAEGVDLVQPYPGLGAVVVEQAQLDSLGDLGEEGEVGARAVVAGAERIGTTRPCLHRWCRVRCSRHSRLLLRTRRRSGGWRRPGRR